jgi:hypothetical protein
MNLDEDIQFLESFRQKIVDYLFLGFAPTETDYWSGENLGKMQKALEQKKFQDLRRDINQMKGRAQQILSRCGVGIVLTQYPAPAVGGPILRFNLFDLVTENRASEGIEVHSFADKIDEAIGVLQHMKTQPSAQAPAIELNVTKGFAFIVMPMSSNDAQLDDVHDAIKDAASSVGLLAERVDEPASNDRITDRILDSLKSAEFVIADLTHAKPNVYYEAGFAHALGKVPIYVAREGTRIEFDLKDYPVIFFRNIRELKSSLVERLKGLLAKRRN